MHGNRRSFLKKTVATAGVIAAGPIAVGLENGPWRGDGPVVSAAAADRAPLPGGFALQLDGAAAGNLLNVDGGMPYADVVEFRFGDETVFRKHPGTVHYDDIRLRSSLGMSRDYCDWLSNMVAHDPSSRSGAVLTGDARGNVVSANMFSHGLITELGFPACDAASKDPGFFSLTVAPELTRLDSPGGSLPAAKKQKQWLPANFRLQIAGLEQACTRVNKIEALVFKQKVIESDIGEGRVITREPGKLEVPNLVFTLPEADLGQVMDWFTDFILHGNSQDESEKEGSLVFLSPDLREELIRLTFHHLGIFKLAPEPMQPADQVRRWRAEMYMEAAELSFGAGAIG